MAYRCVTTLKEIHKYLGDAALVAFDFETAPMDDSRSEEKAALDAHKAFIVGVSLSIAEGTAVYVPLAHRCGQNAEDPKAVMDYLKTAVFQNPRVTKVAHNLSFEAMFLYARGIILQPPVYDTIAASQMTLKSGTQFRKLSDSGLKTLVPMLFKVEMPSFETVTAGRHFDELDPQDAETIRYACADSDYTLRLYHRFNGWFDRYLPKHRFIVENIESPTVIYVGLMKYNGLLMDKDLMLAKQAQASERLAKLKEDIASIIGDVDIGANAGTSAFKNYLFKDLGLPVLKSTAKQQDAADDETMILLSEWCKENKPALAPLFELVQEYRKWGKLKSTYIDGYLEHINSATGRIHSDMMPLGAGSGRFSCRMPNLQNQGQASSLPVNVRSFIIAPPGHRILEADYSQIELRLAAYLSRDQTMLDAYAGNEDIHAITTAAIYRIPLAEAADKQNLQYKKRRTVAKSSIFGVLYGIYKKGLQRNLKAAAGINFTVEQCGMFIDSLKREYSTLAAWQINTMEKARLRLYAETGFGRRRYVPNIVSQDFMKRGGAERTALNHGVQGLAAELLKISMGRLLPQIAERPWLKPLLTVHDSLVFYLSQGREAEAAELIKACMEAAPPIEGFNVPIIAETALGTDYGNMKEV